MVHREMLINGFFIGGECDQAVGKEVIRAPFDGRVVGTAAEGRRSEAFAALGAAAEAFETWRWSTRGERQMLLRKIATSVRERSEELAQLLAVEVGKPITAARGEVLRLGLTFDLAADALADWGLESLPLDYDPRGEGYTCIVERFPIGPILCIVPYNWPYNLAAHKIAPALATGNTVVLKPSNQAPLSTLTLARIIHEAGCPAGVLNAVVIPPAVAESIATDDRTRMVSFTGSPGVGWHLKKVLAEKRVSLELGGDASAIVCEDADLDWAIPRLTAGGYGYAGQICISIQHALVHASRYEEVKARLVEATERCPTGDPLDEKTVCGPLISSEAAGKVMSFLEDAVKSGAKILAGGTREGNIVNPTLVENVQASTKLGCEEVFGPVMTLQPFNSLEEALKRVNSSQYGIQAGVFTNDTRTADEAFRKLEVGGVIINDYPTLRFDNMPYGGVKRSGFGREGVRYAMEEMTELKAMVVKNR